MIELNEKYLQSKNPLATMSNEKCLMETRLLTTVCAGIVCGILGFDGALGIVFWILVDLCVGVALLVRFGFQAEPYFTSVTKIFMKGLGSNVMPFMVSWVFFYNLVYIL